MIAAENLGKRWRGDHTVTVSVDGGSTSAETRLAAQA